MTSAAGTHPRHEWVRLLVEGQITETLYGLSQVRTGGRHYQVAVGPDGDVVFEGDDGALYLVEVDVTVTALPKLPPECPGGCGCRWRMDAERSECACGGPCQMPEDDRGVPLPGSVEWGQRPDPDDDQDDDVEDAPGLRALAAQPRRYRPADDPDDPEVWVRVMLADTGEEIATTGLARLPWDHPSIATGEVWVSMAQLRLLFSASSSTPPAPGIDTCRHHPSTGVDPRYEIQGSGYAPEEPW